MTGVLQPLEYFFLWICISGRWHINSFLYTQEHGTGKSGSQSVFQSGLKIHFSGPAAGCLSCSAHRNEDWPFKREKPASQKEKWVSMESQLPSDAQLAGMTRHQPPPNSGNASGTFSLFLPRASASGQLKLVVTSARPQPGFLFLEKSAPSIYFSILKQH